MGTKIQYWHLPGATPAGLSCLHFQANRKSRSCCEGIRDELFRVWVVRAASKSDRLIHGMGKTLVLNAKTKESVWYSFCLRINICFGCHRTDMPCDCTTLYARCKTIPECTVC